MKISNGRNIKWLERIECMTSKTKLSHTSIDCGDQRRTTGSMPLVASRQVDGWACTQLTMLSSAWSTLTRLVLQRSQMKRLPSSEPAAMYCAPALAPSRRCPRPRLPRLSSSSPHPATDAMSLTRRSPTKLAYEDRGKELVDHRAQFGHGTYSHDAKASLSKLAIRNQYCIMKWTWTQVNGIKSAAGEDRYESSEGQSKDQFQWTFTND